MACCGSDVTKYYDKETILKKLRTIDNLDCNMKLNDSQFSCDFNQYKGEWRNNFNTVQPLMSLQYDEEIKQLKQDLFDIEIKCEELEKLYLAKTLKLLYMAQTHCQIKSDNEKLFERYGIKSGNKIPDLNNLDSMVKSNIFPHVPNSLQKSNTMNNNMNRNHLEQLQ